MKKISVKIIFILITILFSISIIPRLFIMLFPVIPLVESGIYVISNIISVLISLSLFALAINHFIIKRIINLSEATKIVAKGNFDIKIKVIGDDEISKLTNNFNKMAEELKANEYLSKNFVRNVSHEIKTPISSIKGYAELIAAGKLSENELKEYANIIVNETERLSKLSKSMLQLSLLDSTVIIKKEDNFNVAEQIRNILQLMQVEWENKGIDFDLMLNEIYIVSNKELTYQIWQNLISNAIKFSNINGKISIKLVEVDKGIIFEITDYGIGISEENNDKIFQQFFIENKTINKQGSGLGLTITKNIVEKLEGNIKVISIKGEKTTFIVELK